MKSIVITGVSSGIGLATASSFITRGWQVFGVARNPEVLQDLSGRFGQLFVAVVGDVADSGSIEKIRAQVEDRLGESRLDALVNNAGIAVGGPFAYQPFDEFRRHFDVNALGAMELTNALLPSLGVAANRIGTPGVVVNMSSIGGRVGAPFLSGYVASKHALEGWSKSLRVELKAFGIDVVVVGPGHVATPIWDKAEQHDASAYSDSVYRIATEKFTAQMIRDGRKGWPPERIAKVIEQAVTSKRRKTRYAPVQGRIINWTIPTLMPDRVFAAVAARMFNIRRNVG
jgi:NAD(P)-dependent dehydrogenase (short-subunit alcohol dehydrogenase family)